MTSRKKETDVQISNALKPPYTKLLNLNVFQLYSSGPFLNWELFVNGKHVLFDRLT